MRPLAKLFLQKSCDGERIYGDDKGSHYGKACCPEGIPPVEVHL